VVGMLGHLVQTATLTESCPTTKETCVCELLLSIDSISE
jgi:hypothetical protein